MEEGRLALAGTSVMGTPASAQAAQYPHVCERSAKRQKRAVVRIGIHPGGGNGKENRRAPTSHTQEELVGSLQGQLAQPSALMNAITWS